MSFNHLEIRNQAFNFFCNKSQVQSLYLIVVEGITKSKIREIKKYVYR